MRVLIVDDQPLAQTALANILSARSDVEHFDSANDAIEVLEKIATSRICECRLSHFPARWLPASH